MTTTYTPERRAAIEGILTTLLDDYPAAQVIAYNRPVHLTKRNRQTGTMILVSQMPEKDEDGFGWITFCLTHLNDYAHTTRKDAMDFAAAPKDWCPACRGDDTSGWEN